MSFHSNLPDDSVNVTRHSPLADAVWMLGGLLALVIGLYVVLGFGMEAVVKKISIEQEQELFSYLHLDALLDNNTSTTSQKVQHLVTALQEQCLQTPYRFSVSIAEDEQSNAFALPGGFIVVNKGLLDKATSENEIVFVLAHEIAHFQNRDHLEGIGRRFIGVLLGSLIGFSDVNELLQTTLNLSENRFSQTQESEADIYALDLMQCYYGHVNGATDFFKHLPNDSGNYGMFATHPDIRQRVDDIERYSAQQGYGSEALTKH